MFDKGKCWEEEIIDKNKEISKEELIQLIETMDDSIKISWNQKVLRSMIWLEWDEPAAGYYETMKWNIEITKANGFKKMEGIKK